MSPAAPRFDMSSFRITFIGSLLSAGAGHRARLGAQIEPGVPQPDHESSHEDHGSGEQKTEKQKYRALHRGPRAEERRDRGAPHRVERGHENHGVRPRAPKIFSASG